MNYTTLLAAIAAPVILLLTSCGDGKSTTETTDPTTEAAPVAVADPYPLDVCVISGEKLGSMGKPHVVTHEGTEVRLCCDDCLDEFNKDPAKYVAMVKAGKAPSEEGTDHSGHQH